MVKGEKYGVMIVKPGQVKYQLQHLPWSEKSPDLNIIKPLWII